VVKPSTFSQRLHKRLLNQPMDFYSGFSLTRELLDHLREKFSMESASDETLTIFFTGPEFR